MNKFIRLILIFSLLNSNLAYTKSKCDCKEDEVTVVFFNGVANKRQQAEKSRTILEKRLGEVRNGVKLSYELFYNSTAGLWADLDELDDQFLRENGSSLLERHEVLYYSESFNNILEYYKKSKNPELQKSYSHLLNYREQRKEYLIKNFERTNTDYCIHNTELEKLMNECKKILFVAHSQGNIFANRAYKRAMTRNYSKDTIKVVHLAPPIDKDKLNGDYLLSSKDIVINDLLKLRTVPHKAPEPNYIFKHVEDRGCFSQECLARKADYLGHGLNEIYLNPRLDIFNETQRLIDKSLTELSC